MSTAEETAPLLRLASLDGGSLLTAIVAPRYVILSLEDGPAARRPVIVLSREVARELGAFLLVRTGNPA